MRFRFAVLLVIIVGTIFAAAPSARAVEIQPHRALYQMTLLRSRDDSGLAYAHGIMAYQWGETCDAWTIDQRYRLILSYAQRPDVDIRSTFATWESKDGLRYRFDQKESRNGTPGEEIEGAATLKGKGQGGVAVFTKPKREILQLAPGVLFPSAHTILLINEARAGTTFVVRHVFDGSTTGNAVEVSAVIGKELPATPAAAKMSPILKRRGWPVRLAFFPADSRAEKPDYELGMRLLDNGISRDMVIDYGEYAIRAKLVAIEPLKKPHC